MSELTKIDTKSIKILSNTQQILSHFGISGNYSVSQKHVYATCSILHLVPLGSKLSMQA